MVDTHTITQSHTHTRARAHTHKITQSHARTQSHSLSLSLSLSLSVPHNLSFKKNYLLTPRSRALLEKITGSQLVKEFPAYYGIWRFITAFTRARHLSLAWAKSIQYTPPHPTSWRSILILSWSTPGSSKWSLSLRFRHQNPVYASPLPHTCYLTHPSHSTRFYHSNYMSDDYRSLSSSLFSFLHSPVTLSLFGPSTLINTLFSNTFRLRSLP